MDAYENLSNAIVKQAADDYASAFMGNKVGKKEPESVMLECESFFRSEWYAALTSGAIDGNWLARNIKIRELEKVQRAYEEILCVCNNVTFRATVSFPKVKGQEKKKQTTFTFPPRFAKGIADILKKQLEDVKAEIKNLKKKGEATNI